MSDCAVVREISGIEVQTVEVPAKGGHLVRVSVQKGDLLLLLTVYDPNGNKLLDASSYTFSPIEAGFIAGSSGTYKLELTSREKTEQRRAFCLSIPPQRLARSEDKADLNTLALLIDADRMMLDWTRESFEKAIAKLDEAHSISIEKGDFGSAAKASKKSGYGYFILGRYGAALERYARAADEARSAGDSEATSEAVIEAGRLFSYLGNNNKATRFLERELKQFGNQTNALQGSLRPKWLRATALSHLGEVRYSRGNLVKAYAALNEAIKLFGEVGDRSGEARARLFIGYVLGGFGEPGSAGEQFYDALALYRAAGNRVGEGLSLTAIGLTKSYNREDEKAISLHGQAMDIFSAIGDERSVAVTLNAKGQAYEHMGEHSMALTHYLEALKLGEANESVDFVGSALYQIGEIYQLLGERDQAVHYYERCLRLSRDTQKMRTQANAQAGLARIYAADGHRQKALQHFDLVLNLYSAMRDRRGKAITLNHLGDYLLSLGQSNEAFSVYEQALLLSKKAHEKGVEISTLYNVARATRAAGRLDDALKYVEQSIDLIEEIRVNVASPDFRSSLFAAVRRNYYLKIDLLMDLERQRPGNGFAIKALQVSEGARARSLVDLLTEASRNIREGVDPAILRRERELEAVLRHHAQSQLSVSGKTKTNVESEEDTRQLDALKAEYQQIQAQLRDHSLPRLPLAHPMTIEEIQAELADGNTMLLEYALGDEESYLWAVTADSVRSYELPGRSVLESLATEVYKLLTARQKPIEGEQSDQQSIDEADRLYYEKAAQLSAMLLGPIEHLSKNRLVIVSEGVLQYIPFEALPIPSGRQNSSAEGVGDGAPLVLVHEVISLPSVSTLAAIRREKRNVADANKIVAVLADPVFGNNDVRLTKTQNAKDSAFLATPSSITTQRSFNESEGLTRGASQLRLLHTAREAEAISEVTPEGLAMVVTGFDANRQLAMSQLLSDYKILHLATHGSINSERPELSAIVLSTVDQSGSEINGLLQLHDIYSLKLAADLVVLSACDTALGKDVKGEGLQGLTRGFMYAGARSVVASLWKVDDRATAVLMGYFYKAMLQDGMTPSAALRHAKQKMLTHKNWRAPYFWAGLVIQGEYNQRIEVESGRSVYPVFWLALALLVVGPMVFVFLRRRRFQGKV